MAQAFDHRLAGEECLVGVRSLAKGRKGCGGVLSVGLGTDGRAEGVIEVRGALRRRDGIAAADMRLVDELLVAALDEREAIPEEGFGFGQGRGTAVGTECRPYRRGGELPVGVVSIRTRRVAVGYREDLVEVAVAVGLVAFLDETPRRVVGVARGDAVGRGRDELVRVVKCEGGRLSVDGLLEHVAGLAADAT